VVPTPLQCRYGVRDAFSSRRNTLATWRSAAGTCCVRAAAPRSGLSAGILGQRLPPPLAPHARTRAYGARSIVENVEYQPDAGSPGLGVRWVDDAQVRGDNANSQPRRQRGLGASSARAGKAAACG